MRPALKSGLLPVWRDRDTLQIGIDPRRAIALSGMSGAAPLIALLDGSRDRAQLIAAAAGQGVPPQTTERVLTLLAAGGALDDFPAATLRELPPELRSRLAPELATTSLAHRDSDGGARALARRRNAMVRVEGEPRIARAVVRILSRSGVGQVEFIRPPDVPQALAPGPRRDLRLAWPDTGPAPDHYIGEQPSQDGQQEPAGGAPGRPGRVRARPGTARNAGLAAGRPSRAAGAGAAAMRRAAAGPGRAAALSGRAARLPDLVILAGRQLGGGHATELTRQRVPHLSVLAGEAIGVVGPLVIPGRTACLRCLDYARAANDPSWPLILAQIARRRPEPAASDTVLTTAVAAQAAAQALLAVDKAPIASAAVNGTLELVLPGWRWRRRTWPPHPACPCASHTIW
ncbi:MAG: hypothetical protein ACR2FU_16205 [Streptosporangiaceae bacterium]